MLGSLTSKAAPLLRRGFSTGVNLRSGHHDNTGRIGHNLPFNIWNIPRFTAVFILYVGSGLGVPFLIVRHTLLKGSKV